MRITSTLQFSAVISKENMNLKWISSKLSITRRQNKKTSLQNQQETENQSSQTLTRVFLLPWLPENESNKVGFEWYYKVYDSCVKLYIYIYIYDLL